MKRRTNLLRQSSSDPIAKPPLRNYTENRKFFADAICIEGLFRES